jgi:ankyrin repeat protein
MRLVIGAQIGHAEEMREEDDTMKNEIIEKGQFGMTPLHRACVSRNVDTVSLLLDKGAMINDRNKDGWTPLHYATTNDRADVANLLLEKGADYSILNGDGLAPLDNAIAKGKCQAVELVISLTRKNKELRENMKSEWKAERTRLVKKIAAMNRRRRNC